YTTAHQLADGLERRVPAAPADRVHLRLPVVHDGARLGETTPVGEELRQVDRRVGDHPFISRRRDHVVAAAKGSLSVGVPPLRRPQETQVALDLRNSGDVLLTCGFDGTLNVCLGRAEVAQLQRCAGAQAKNFGPVPTLSGSFAHRDRGIEHARHFGEISAHPQCVRQEAQRAYVQLHRPRFLSCRQKLPADDFRTAGVAGPEEVHGTVSHHVDRRVAQPQLGRQRLSLLQEAIRQLDVATYGFDRGKPFEDGSDTWTIADRPGLCEEVQADGDELVEPACRERNVVLDLPRLDLTGDVTRTMHGLNGQIAYPFEFCDDSCAAEIPDPGRGETGGRHRGQQAG